MALAVVPLAITLAFFSKDILQLWARDPQVVLGASTLVSILVIGNAINGLMHIPHALCLAYGWTALPFYQTLVATIVLVPATLSAALRWGAPGAACVWVFFALCSIVIGAQFTFWRLLPREKLRWYIFDVLIPIGTSLAVIIPARLAVTQSYPIFLRVVGIGGSFCLALLVTAISLDTIVRRLADMRGLATYDSISA